MPALSTTIEPGPVKLISIFRSWRLPSLVEIVEKGEVGIDSNELFDCRIVPPVRSIVPPLIVIFASVPMECSSSAPNHSCPSFSSLPPFLISMLILQANQGDPYWRHRDRNRSATNRRRPLQAIVRATKGAAVENQIGRIHLSPTILG